MNTTTNLTFVLVPATVELKQLKVAELANRALEFERMLAAGTQRESNLSQYILLCQRMEEMAIEALALDGAVSCNASEVYLRALMKLSDTKDGNSSQISRLFSVFCPPDEVKACAQFLFDLFKSASGELRDQIERVATVYSLAAKKRQTLVVLQNHLATSQGVSIFDETELVNMTERYQKLYVSDSIEDNSDKKSWEIFREHVWNQIRAANHKQPNALNPALAKNNVLTEVLHNSVYRRDDQKGYPKPVSVKVVYADGSEARPFTMLCLRKRKGDSIKKELGAVILHVGQISSRHPEMDSDVEIYWFPNALVSQTRTSAETDEVAYQHSLKQFADLRKTGKKYLIYFYQTGFQQALMGFLRALCEELVTSNKSQQWLKVMPRHYAGKDRPYEKGEPWF